MAPPLVRGGALVRRRLAGVVFLLVLGLLVELTVALYRKQFSPVVRVALQTDRVGNQLTVHADVKVRGIVVGEVRRISSHGDGATLELAILPDRARSIPQSVSAQLLPKTLFGEKEVALVLPPDGPGRHLRSGDVIPQDRSTTALETETALNDLLPVLQSLRPAELSMTLNALSGALRGRGNRLGANAVRTGAYLRRLNPELPRLAQDMQGLADDTNTTADVVPDLVRVLDNLSFSSRSLVQQRSTLDGFLRTTGTFAGSAQTLLAQDEQRFVALARDSRPSLDLYARDSPGYPCLLNRLVAAEKETERTFGGGQPGLHITLEVVRDKGGYSPGEEPRYRDTSGPTCFGLGPRPVRPFPVYRNSQDGYRDGDPPEQPGTGPGRSTPSAWYAPMVDTPVVGAEQQVSLPQGMSSFGALLVTVLA